MAAPSAGVTYSQSALAAAITPGMWMRFGTPAKMGLEGIVSKRLGSRYVSGRSSDWLKTKNPAAPAVKREAEEGLGAMSKRKLKPWMRVEQAIIWSVGVIASLMVAAGIAYRAFL